MKILIQKISFLISLSTIFCDLRFSMVTELC